MVEYKFTTTKKKSALNVMIRSRSIHINMAVKNTTIFM